MPKVSVIIPCYNQGHYLDEAVGSVLAQTYEDYEIIVVNDGSTDEYTINLLANYDRLKTRIIHTLNQGLASARNSGIMVAEGKYILPLDSDDKIGKEYLAGAVRILDVNDDVGIVYCLAESFDGKKGRWVLPDYSLEKMLLANLIFCSACFRKSDWEKVGGYNPNMKYGWEDWDFWLSVIGLGRKVHRLDQILFYYRLKDSSMLKAMDRERQIEMYAQLVTNHKDLYAENIRLVIGEMYDVIHSWPFKLHMFIKNPRTLLAKFLNY